MHNLTFVYDNNIKKSLYEQLYEHIAKEIHMGKISEGERLPSKKSLASHLKISVNTVETAYSMLVDEGYIVSKPRSGYYVQRVQMPVLNEVSSFNKEEVKKQADNKYKIDFKTNSVDVKSFPYTTWVKLSREIMYSKPELLDVGDFRGDIELRESIAKYLHEFRGVRTKSENIVIGAGIEYLLTLLTHILKGKIYAVENPGYSKAEQIFKNSANAVNYIPVDDGGMSIEYLNNTNSDIVYLTPSHQFPTGVVMPIGRRFDLIRWVTQKEGRYIIEDDYNGEFNFGIKPTPAIQGLSKSGKVIYVSTFSRILAPSIRISYMALPDELMSEYEKHFSGYTCTVPRFEQHTLNSFIEGGYFSRHLNRVKNVYRKRCERLYEILNVEDVQISGEKTGLHLLIKTPRAEEFIEAARKKGINLYRLDDYFFSPPQQSSDTVIIGYGGCCDEDIEELGCIVKDIWKSEYNV